MEQKNPGVLEFTEPFQKEKESKYRWLVLFITFLAIVVTFIDRVNLSAAAPGMMKEFKWSPAVMGIVLSAFSWSYMIAQIPGGYLLDRFGIKKVYSLSFSFWGLITMATSTVSSVFGLGFFRVLLGLSEAPLYPGLTKILYTWFKKTQSAFAMTILSVALNVGLAVGAKVSTWSVHNFGWRPMFVITGLISLIIVPVYFLLYREFSPKETPATNSGQTTAAGKDLKWYHLLKERNILALTLGYFGANYSLYLFITWLPDYFVKQWHFSLMKTGTFAAIVFLSGLIGKPFFGWLSGYLIKRGWSVTASRKTMMVVLSLLGASIGIAAIAPNPILAAVLLAVAETTGQAGGSITWATAADITPRGMAAQTGGIQNMASGFAGIVAPIVTGFLLAATGSFYLPLIVAALICLLSAASYGLLLGKVEPVDLKYISAARSEVTSHTI